MTGDQITVAELLARKKAAGEEAAAAEKTRRERRRHRNIDDGGVSVAELTGSIPVVRDEDDDASKPSSHSQNQETKAEPKAESKVKTEAKTEPEAKAEPKTKAEPKSEPKAGAEVKAKAEPKAEPKPKPEDKIENTVEPKPEKKADSKADTVATEPKTAEKAAPKAPVAKASVPKPAIENQVPNLGKTVKAAPSAAKSEVKTAAKAATPKAAEKSETTAVSKPETKVDAKEQPPKTAAEAEPASAAQPAPKSTETKGNATLAEQAAAVASQKHDPQVTPKGVVKDPTTTPKVAAPEPVEKKTNVAEAGGSQSAAKTSAVASTQAASEAAASVNPDIATNDAQSTVTAEQKAPQTAAPENTAEAASADDHEDEGRISIPILILEIILALAVGAGIFMGFEILWERFSTIITGALALIVTAVVVGVVHALLKKRDALILVLAAIVGLALTFGPMLITNI